MDLSAKKLNYLLLCRINREKHLNRRRRKQPKKVVRKSNLKGEELSSLVTLRVMVKIAKVCAII